MIKTLNRIVRRTPLVETFRNALRRQKEETSRQDFWKCDSEDMERLDFYGQFVSSGDIVFDVGANLGNRSKIFSLIGAEVVAVEPQDAVASQLEHLFQGTSHFHLVRKALGRSTGTGEIQTCDAHTISSMSPKWIESVKQSGRFANYEWSQTQTVVIDTLDNLINTFGTPKFIKIDVEGFEFEVLGGLTKPVQALSFEFAKEVISTTSACIETLHHLGNYQFQISLEESMEFALDEWVDAQQMRQLLENFDADSWGDIYARLS